MIGKSKIEITQATLVRAVQLYFTGEFGAGRAPNVTRVTLTRGSGDTYDNAIVVECDGPDAHAELAAP